MALIPSLVQELPCAMGAAKKKEARREGGRRGKEERKKEREKENCSLYTRQEGKSGDILFYFYLLFGGILRPHLQHIEVPRLRVE